MEIHLGKTLDWALAVRLVRKSKQRAVAKDKRRGLMFLGRIRSQRDLVWRVAKEAMARAYATRYDIGMTIR